MEYLPDPQFVAAAAGRRFIDFAGVTADENGLLSLNAEKGDFALIRSTGRLWYVALKTETSTVWQPYRPIELTGCQCGLAGR